MITEKDLANRGPEAVMPLRNRRRTREDEDETPEPARPDARLATARSVEPGNDRHNVAAWRQGRDETIGAVTLGLEIRAAAHLAAPSPIGCSDCWRRGRDATIRILLGAQ